MQIYNGSEKHPTPHSFILKVAHTSGTSKNKTLNNEEVRGTAFFQLWELSIFA